MSPSINKVQRLTRKKRFCYTYKKRIRYIRVNLIITSNKQNSMTFLNFTREAQNRFFCFTIH